MTVKIVTDSTCDLPPEIIKKYDITVVPVYVNLGDKSYQDGESFDRNSFYSAIEKTKAFPSTASPAIDQFTRAFSQLATKGAESILSIHLSSTIGGVFNVAQLASQAVKNILIRPFDTGQISLGTGFIVAAAAKMAKAGKDLHEILTSIEDMVSRTYTFAVVDNLKYLKHSGRISQFKTLLGSILQVKPILRFHQGIPTVEIVRTSKVAVDHLIQSVRSLGRLERVSVLHIHAPEKARLLFTEAEKHFAGKLSGCIQDVSPAIGTHIGPGTIGIAAVVASPEK